MKIWRGITATGVLALAISGAALHAPADPVPTAAEGWLPSFEAAQAAARQAGKPIFLVFR
jgi:hypothetical protein